jgi:hypothetical protein
MRVILAPSFEIAKSLPTPDLTVEAEYGSQVWEGAVYTAAHHQSTGPFAGRHITEGGRPSPCNDPEIPDLTRVEGRPTRGEEGCTIGVSHIDLDTIGGCLRAVGARCMDPAYQSFWDLAEFVDVTGPHKLGLAGASEEDEARLWAFWAWKEANVPHYFSREEVTDVSEIVGHAIDALSDILGVRFAEAAWRGEAHTDEAQEPHDALMAAGRKMKADQRALSTATAKTFVGEVVLRSSSQFVNHLYVWGVHVYRACVTFNPDAGSITISLAEPVDGVNCCELVQSWWGPEAGGHPGIAGSPRGQELTWEDAETAAQKVRSALLLAEPRWGPRAFSGWDSSTQEK